MKTMVLKLGCFSSFLISCLSIEAMADTESPSLNLKNRSESRSKLASSSSTNLSGSTTGVRAESKLASGEKKATLSAKPPAGPIAFSSSGEYIDVRGVGDTGWTIASESPEKNEFAELLKSFDPEKVLLRGDLNFINWESTVGPSCDKWNQVQFPFQSPPEAIRAARDFGFNLFSMSNNHAEDCAKYDTKMSGSMRTRFELSSLAKGNEMLWHGVGKAHEISRIATGYFLLKGKKIKVAFAAVSFLNWRTHSTARGESSYHGEKILESMAKSDAKLKILSIHTQSTLEQGKIFGVRFIKEAGGDIVFAQGSHRWEDVESLQKSDGRMGVIFHGLGNFSHTGCVSGHKNIMARVLLNKETLDIAQVQIVPFSNLYRGELKLSKSKSLPAANFEWQRAHIKAGQNVFLGYHNFSGPSELKVSE
jgi:hypothetical protein